MYKRYGRWWTPHKKRAPSKCDLVVKSLCGVSEVGQPYPSGALHPEVALRTALLTE